MRYSLIEPIPEIFVAATRLQEAVEAHLAEQFTDAARLFEEADNPKIRAFTEQSWGKGSKGRFSFRSIPDAPPKLPLATRPLPRMPSASTQRLILSRDGHHCRFCGMPVIGARVRQVANALYPQSVHWGRSNADQHAAFQCMWLQFDHILPNSRGGESVPDNVVVTCAPCNFGRMESTLEEADLFHPLEVERTPVWEGHAYWDGLSCLMTNPCATVS